MDIYTQGRLSDPLKQKLITILASVFEVIVVATQEVRRGRVKAYFKKLTGSEGPIHLALEKLKALTLGEERLVLAETYGGVYQINSKTDRVECMISQVNDNLQSLRFDHYGQGDRDRREKLKGILEPSPYPEDFFSAFTKSRVAGTGDWLLQDESLQSWITEEKQHLWISGSPGTGKSFLTARLIAWGAENLPRLAYFFFRENNPETRSVVQALRDIAYQLSESDVEYAKFLTSTISSSDDIRTVSSAFRRLLLEPCQSSKSFSVTYIFLDGIDEADADEISQLLFQLAPEDGSPAFATPKLRIALVGRSYMSETVTRALDRQICGGMTSVQITPDRCQGDVSAYIARGVQQSRILNQMAPEFKQRVVDLMNKQVDGLFILAKFMLAEVNRKSHPRSILKSLETYPKEVSGMLERAIDSVSTTISEEEAEDLNEMLKWIACAEEALTIEQLEAALVLEFGDPPFRLEESLRGQYACFFELEREDGMTTDDIIKDFERKRREASQDGSPRLRISGDGKVVIGSPSSDTGLSPLKQAVHSRGSSVSSLSSGRRGSATIHSPTRSIDLATAGHELEFRSKKSTTVVTFFHATVREFFLNLSKNASEARRSSLIQFDSVAARLHVVKRCIKIFTDPEWFAGFNLGTGCKAIKQYAAWYWQEHLARLDPASVSAADKKELGMKIYRMMNDDSIIFEWTILYKKTNEGLVVLTDRNILAIMHWFEDTEVLAGLDEAAREFAMKLDSKPAKLCERIGRLYAEAWVSAEYKAYIPTIFCFDIVQSVALMEAGYSWTQSHEHWLEIPLDQRIETATKWTGFEETGYWHRRIGSTYLTLGKYDKALEYYNKALSIDNNRQQTYGRIAYCLTQENRYSEALDPALECVSMEEKSLANGVFHDDALARSKWRLYKDYFLVAKCYCNTYQLDQALEYYGKAIAMAVAVELNPNELFESEISYLEALSSENRHQDVMNLLGQMALQLTKKTKGQSRLIEMVLHHNTTRLVLDWIPRAASKTGRTEFVLQTLVSAIGAAHDLRDPVVILYLRLAYGMACAYSYQPENAIDTFERISLVEYRARGNLMTRQAHSISFQQLAGLYKQQLLNAGLHTSEAGEWLKRLEVIQRKQSQHQRIGTPANVRGSDVNTASIYLGLFYRLQGRIVEANRMLSGLVNDSMDLLSDTEPLNDEFALDNLLWVLLAADDEQMAAALAQSMRKVDPNASLTSQSESPVLERLEPKLPNILSADRNCEQCLDNISSSEDFFICKFCMECFCGKCLRTVIQQPNNNTSDHRNEVRCRNDHQWLTVPPLAKALHTGQIMYTNGEREEFAQWTQKIKQGWSTD